MHKVRAILGKETLRNFFYIKKKNCLHLFDIPAAKKINELFERLALRNSTPKIGKAK